MYVALNLCLLFQTILWIYILWYTGVHAGLEKWEVNIGSYSWNFLDPTTLSTHLGLDFSSQDPPSIPASELLSPSRLTFRNIPHSVDTSIASEYHSGAGSPALSFSYAGEPPNSYTSDDSEVTGFLPLPPAPRLQGSGTFGSAHGLSKNVLLPHQSVCLYYCWQLFMLTSFQSTSSLDSSSGSSSQFLRQYPSQCPHQSQQVDWMRNEIEQLRRENFALQHQYTSLKWVSNLYLTIHDQYIFELQRCIWYPCKLCSAHRSCRCHFQLAFSTYISTSQQSSSNRVQLPKHMILAQKPMEGAQREAEGGHRP